MRTAHLYRPNYLLRIFSRDKMNHSHRAFSSQPLPRVVVPLGLKNKKVTAKIVGDHLVTINTSIDISAVELQTVPCPGCSKLEPVINFWCMKVLVHLEGIEFFISSSLMALFSYLPSRRCHLLETQPTSSQLACLLWNGDADLPHRRSRHHHDRSSRSQPSSETHLH